MDPLAKLRPTPLPNPEYCGFSLLCTTVGISYSLVLLTLSIQLLSLRFRTNDVLPDQIITSIRTHTLTCLSLTSAFCYVCRAGMNDKAKSLCLQTKLN